MSLFFARVSSRQLFTLDSTSFSELPSRHKSVERELSFLNLIVVRNHDAKICISFVTRCGVSVILSSFTLFVFKVRFGPNDCNFSKAVCVFNEKEKWNRVPHFIL